MSIDDPRLAAAARPPPPRRAQGELLAFEWLLAELTAGFDGLEAERIDAAIEDALRRIVQALHIDRCSLIVVSPFNGRVETTHSWAAPGMGRTPPLNIVDSNPWGLGEALAGRPVVFARLDDLPPEAAVDRATAERIGLKSHVTMPMHVAGRLRGGIGFGALRLERDWPPALLRRMRMLADVLAGVVARQQPAAQRERALDFERLATRTLGALLVAAPQDEPRIIEAGLRDLARFLGADRAALWELGPGEGPFRRTHGAWADGVQAAEHWSTAGLPWIGRQLQAEALVRLARIDELPSAAGDRLVCGAGPDADVALELARALHGRARGCRWSCSGRTTPSAPPSTWRAWTPPTSSNARSARRACARRCVGLASRPKPGRRHDSGLGPSLKRQPAPDPPRYPYEPHPKETAR